MSGAALVYYACPVCLGLKGAEEKQMCNACWGPLPLAAKVEWYKRRNNLLVMGHASVREWHGRKTAVAS